MEILDKIHVTQNYQLSNGHNYFSYKRGDFDLFFEKLKRNRLENQKLKQKQEKISLNIYIEELNDENTIREVDRFESLYLNNNNNDKSITNSNHHTINVNSNNESINSSSDITDDSLNKYKLDETNDNLVDKLNEVNLENSIDDDVKQNEINNYKDQKNKNVEIENNNNKNHINSHNLDEYKEYAEDSLDKEISVSHENSTSKNHINLVNNNSSNVNSIKETKAKKENLKSLEDSLDKKKTFPKRKEKVANKTKNLAKNQQQQQQPPQQMFSNIIFYNQAYDEAFASLPTDLSSPQLNYSIPFYTYIPNDAYNNYNSYFMPPQVHQPHAPLLHHQQHQAQLNLSNIDNPNLIINNKSNRKKKNIYNYNSTTSSSASKSSSDNNNETRFLE